MEAIHSLLDILIDISKSPEDYKKLDYLFKFLKKWPHLHFNPKTLSFGVKHKRFSQIFFNLYTFEKKYVLPLKHNYNNQIKKLKYRVNNLKQKLYSLYISKKGVCFGGKKTFKAQYTLGLYKDNHLFWLKTYRGKRENKLRHPGNINVSCGNRIFKFYPDQNRLILYWHKKRIVINKISFPYGEDKINEIFTFKKSDSITEPKYPKKNRVIQPILWTIEDNGDYYIFKATVNVPNGECKISSTSNGVIGIDINIDNISWVEVDGIGNTLDTGIIRFNLLEKSSNQANEILRNNLYKLFDLAKTKSKPIVAEDIDLEWQRSKMRYKNPKANKSISQFPYVKIRNILESGKTKFSIEVHFIDPRFTSLIGKLKFMRSKGLSIHESAALAIARRKIVHEERLPKPLWKLLPDKIKKNAVLEQWAYVYRQLKNIPTHTFYKHIDYNRLKSFSELKKLLHHFAYNPNEYLI
jgi:IS605 OrfB family transposase